MQSKAAQDLRLHLIDRVAQTQSTHHNQHQVVIDQLLASLIYVAVNFGSQYTDKVVELINVRCLPCKLIS